MLCDDWSLESFQNYLFCWWFRVTGEFFSLLCADQGVQQLGKLESKNCGDFLCWNAKMVCTSLLCRWRAVLFQYIASCNLNVSSNLDRFISLCVKMKSGINNFFTTADWEFFYPFSLDILELPLWNQFWVICMFMSELKVFVWFLNCYLSFTVKREISWKWCHCCLNCLVLFFLTIVCAIFAVVAVACCIVW